MSLSIAFDSNNPTRRLDAEFYKKEFLNLPKFELVLSNISMIRSGTTPNDRDDRLQNGVILLKTIDIQNRPLDIADSNSYYKITREIAQRMQNTRLLSGDILINIVGATTDVIGRVSLVPPDFPEANITQAMALIRLQTERIVPELVFAFLVGKFGQFQIRRLARPTGQFNLNLPEVGRIEIPQFSSLFGNLCEKTISRVASLKSAAFQKIIDADRKLLTTLGLAAWTPPEPLTYLSNFNHVKSAERFDSEFFSPKLDLPIELMKKKKISFISIGEIQTHNTRGVQPEYTETGDVRVVNSRHILDGQLDYENFETTHSGAWHNNPKARILKNDIVIYTTGANIGRTACNQIDGKLIASNHVNILRISHYNPVYVAFVLNSKIGRMQTARYSGGSAQAELYPKDISKFMIPIISEVEQKTILDLLNQSEICRQRSKQLLDVAKRAVEIAIEESEASAMKYLSAFQEAE